MWRAIRRSGRRRQRRYLGYSRLSRAAQFEFAGVEAHGEKGIGPRVSVCFVEFGPMAPEQFIFAQARGLRIRAFLPGDAGNGPDQANDFARRAVGPGILVTGQTRAQVSGLPDVEHPLFRAGHDVNARSARCGAKELFAQPLRQRPGRVEQMELGSPTQCWPLFHKGILQSTAFGQR